MERILGAEEDAELGQQNWSIEMCIEATGFATNDVWLPCFGADERRSLKIKTILPAIDE